MKKKLLILLSLILALSIFAAGCVPKGDDKADTPPVVEPDDKGDKDDEKEPDEPKDETTGEKILRTNNAEEPGSLDPALAQGTHESWILDHAFEGLMKVNENLEIVEGMAESYEVSEDKLTYTFKIRDDAKWSTGDPVTAEDFEFSWKRALDPKLASDYAHQLYYIKGGEAFNTGEGVMDDVMVKAEDEKTLVVTLESPTAYFLELTAFYTLYPVSKKAVEANGDWAKTVDTYVSNGPFKLTEWEHSASLKIRKNDEYYDKDKVMLDGMDFDIIADENTTWQKYEGGDYDFLTPLPQAVVAKMKAENNPELVIAEQVGTYYYNLNSKFKMANGSMPFTNEKIRKAFAMSLDRATIVEKIAQGGQIAAEGVVPLGLKDENGKEYRDEVGKLLEFNEDEAKKMFAEGIKEEGITAADFKQVVLLYNTSEAHKKIAQAAQEMWRVNLGVEIQLENVDFQVKLDREKAGDYQISRAGWIGDYADPITFLELWHSKSSFNDAKYNNPEYDKLVDIAKTSPDNNERFKAMRDAEKMIMEDMPVVPVYFYTQPYAQKPYVTGVFKPLVNYPRLTYVDMNKK
nr:peptide ABC transporter substrate-binding protein [Tissierella sp.]